MSAEFRVRIELGNSEMQRGEEIAEALRKVAEELEFLSMDGTIRDVNGNTVGTYWHVKASMAEPHDDALDEEIIPGVTVGDVERHGEQVIDEVQYRDRKAAEAGAMSTSDGLGADAEVTGAGELRESGWPVDHMSPNQIALAYEAEGDRNHEQVSGERKLWEHQIEDGLEVTDSGTVQAGFEAAKLIAAFLAAPGDWNGGDACDVAATALIAAGLLTKEQCNN